MSERRMPDISDHKSHKNCQSRNSPFRFVAPAPVASGVPLLGPAVALTTAASYGTGNLGSCSFLIPIALAETSEQRYLVPV